MFMFSFSLQEFKYLFKVINELFSIAFSLNIYSVVDIKDKINTFLIIDNLNKYIHISENFLISFEIFNLRKRNKKVSILKCWLANKDQKLF